MKRLVVLTSLIVLIALLVHGSPPPLHGFGLNFGILAPYTGSTFLIGYEQELQYYPLNLTLGLEAFSEIFSILLTEETDDQYSAHGAILPVGYGGVIRAGLRPVNTKFLGIDGYGGVCYISSPFFGEWLAPVYGAGIDLYTDSSSSIRVSATAVCAWDDATPRLFILHIGGISRY